MKINLKPIQDQVVVLFGATSGIGLMTAMKMAEKGARVVIVGRSQDGLNEAQEQVRQHVQNVRMTQSRTNGHDDWMQTEDAAGMGTSGMQTTGQGTGTYPASGSVANTGTTGMTGTMEDTVVAMEADATNWDQVKGVADQVAQRFGRIDTWVNVAGVSEWALFEDTNPQEFNRIIQVNLVGQAYGAMAALPHLRKQDGGALIFVSSMAGRVPLPYQSAYSASKHGLLGLAETLRLEMKHTMTPVSVTAILPTSINTPLFNKARTRLGVEPEPIPPVYDASMAAKSIIYAATHPVRELVVGDAGMAINVMKRVAPTITSNMLGANSFRQQRSNEPKSVEAPDNLYAHIAGHNQVSGQIEPETRSFSPITWLSTHPRARMGVWAGLISAIGFFTGWRLVKARADRHRTFSYRSQKFLRDAAAAIVSWPLISSLPMFHKKTIVGRVVDILPHRKKTLMSRVREIELPDVEKMTRQQRKAAMQMARQQGKATMKAAVSARKAVYKMAGINRSPAQKMADSTKKAVNKAANRSMKAIDKAATQSKKAVLKAADRSKDAASKVADRVPFTNRKSTIERVKDRTEVVTEKIVRK
jgi:NAD(P)-dependent dehydrogenase (short-subunit alcohol dehydrogenase family)